MYDVDDVRRRRSERACCWNLITRSTARVFRSCGRSCCTCLTAECHYCVDCDHTAGVTRQTRQVIVFAETVPVLQLHVLSLPTLREIAIYEIHFTSFPICQFIRVLQFSLIECIGLCNNSSVDDERPPCRRQHDVLGALAVFGGWLHCNDAMIRSGNTTPRDRAAN